MRLLVAISLLFLAAPASAQTADDERQIEKAWIENGPAFDASGIDRNMYRQFHYWLNGQYLLGHCAPHLREEDVMFWRNWWNDTPLNGSDFGRALLLKSAETYDAGVLERLKKPTPRDICLSTVVAWVDEMKVIKSAK